MSKDTNKDILVKKKKVPCRRSSDIRIDAKTSRNHPRKYPMTKSKSNSGITISDGSNTEEEAIELTEGENEEFADFEYEPLDMDDDLGLSDFEDDLPSVSYDKTPTSLVSDLQNSFSLLEQHVGQLLSEPRKDNKKKSI